MGCNNEICCYDPSANFVCPNPGEFIGSDQIDVSIAGTYKKTGWGSWSHSVWLSEDVGQNEDIIGNFC